MKNQQLNANHDAPLFPAAVAPATHEVDSPLRAFLRAAMVACLTLSAGSLAACEEDYSPVETEEDRLMTTCTSACKRMVSAGCSGAASVSRCENNCFEQLTSEDACIDQWEDVWTCFGSARFTCTKDGSASTGDCAPESKALAACAS